MNAHTTADPEAELHPFLADHERFMERDAAAEGVSVETYRRARKAYQDVIRGHTTTEPAAPLELADLEDLVCRVRWMLKAAWDELSEMSPGEGGDVDTKVRHLVRAASELAAELCAEFYAAYDGRTEK